MEKRNGMLYPMMVIAAISVILFSIVGIATMTGHIPSVLSKGDVAAEEQAANKGVTAEKEKGSAEKRIEGGKPQSGKTITGGVASSESRTTRETQPRLAARCGSCGVVESVQSREVKGQGTGLGVVGGAVVGGVLGHQVGSGRGNDLATVAGAIGGGFAGNEIEKNVKKTTQYVIRVRMEDDTYRTITQSTNPSVEAGDRVRIENGALIAQG